MCRWYSHASFRDIWLYKNVDDGDNDGGWQRNLDQNPPPKNGKSFGADMFQTTYGRPFNGCWHPDRVDIGSPN